jgi:hypothetical protein
VLDRGGTQARDVPQFFGEPAARGGDVVLWQLRLLF